MKRGLRPRGWARPAQVVIAAAVLLAFASTACRRAEAPVEPAARSAPPQRIISMAPSLTETVFALGLGDRVVGVTRYCDYPPEARGCASIGGYLDPSWETVVALEPDLVLLIQDQDDTRRRLEGLGLATLQVDHSTVDGIFDSIEHIARVHGVEERGVELIAGIEAQLALVADRIRALTTPRVLVVVGREPGSGGIGTLWAAGPGTFYHDILKLAGGVNVCQQQSLPYPELSREGLLHLDPDVVLDVLPQIHRSGIDAETARGDWAGLDTLRAVRSGRVHVLAEDLMEIPGPRVAEIVEIVARHLHPQARWEEQ